MPGQKPTLIVSPHPDDAVLSCWALLAGPEPVVVLDVFAGSPDPPVQGAWDLRCGFRDSAESSRARREEEARALAGTPHRAEFMELVNVDYVDGRRPREDRDAIVAAVRGRIEEAGGGTVALPAGAGWTMSRLRRTLGERVWWRLIGERPGPPQQPDHVFARDAGLEAVAGTAVDVLLYEEVPYLWGEPADRAVAGLRRDTELIELQVDREEKARRIAAYASQVEHISPPQGRLDDPAVLPATERYWRLG
jgi:GlcNAc-PI de-N-acetylase